MNYRSLQRQPKNTVCNVEFPKPFSVINQYLQLLTEYLSLTSPRNGKRVKHNVAHKIVTTDSPCSARPRPFSPEKLVCAQEEIYQLLEAGIVRKSSSPYSTPLHMVPKQAATGGTYRLCGNCRQFNKKNI